MGAMMPLILQMGQMKLILPPAQGAALGNSSTGPGSLTRGLHLYHYNKVFPLGQGAMCDQVATTVPDRGLPPALPAAGSQVPELNQASLLCVVSKARPQAAPTLPGALSNLLPPSAPFTLHPVRYRREPAWMGTPSSCRHPGSQSRSCARDSRRWCWW